jgi:hypothetical protein
MCCFTRDCNLFSFRPEGGTSYNGDGVPTVHTPCARHTLLCCSASRRCRVQKSCGRVRRRTAADSLLALLGWCWTNERRFRNGLCFDGTCTLCCQKVSSQSTIWRCSACFPGGLVPSSSSLRLARVGSFRAGLLRNLVDQSTQASI